MSKTSIEIDDDKLGEVRAILRTDTKRATVDAALDEVISLRRRSLLVERLRRMEGLDLCDRDVIESAWR